MLIVFDMVFTPERKLVLVLSGLKIFFLFLLTGVAAGHFPFNESLHLANFHYPSSEGLGLLRHFQTWDANWYLFIADNGYTAGPVSAFYPLFPFLIFLLKPFFGLHLSGILLSNVFFLAGVFVFYLLVEQRFSSRIGLLSTLFLLVFPTSFFFSLIYSESLFFLLAVLFFYALQKRWLSTALLCSALAVFTRSQGILLLLPLLYFLFYEQKGSPLSLLSALVPLAAFGLLQCVFYLQTGVWFANFQAQQFFVSHFSIAQLLHPLDWFFRDFLQDHLMIHGFTNSLMDRGFFLLFICLLFPLWKSVDRKWFLYAAALGLVSALSGPLMAYSRYLLVLFPLFVLLALYLDQRPLLRSGILALFLCLQMIFSVSHTLNYWIA